MNNWQRVDQDHSHCSECGNIFQNIALTGGRCIDCRNAMNEKAKEKVNTANAKTLAKSTKAAAQLLSAMQSQGKGGQLAPQLLDSFLEGVGGIGNLGQMMNVEFQKAHGMGVTEAEAAAWGSTTPKLRLQWYELVTRVLDRTDQNRSLDISSLDEADLEAILADLGRKYVLEDKAIQQSAVMAALSDKAFRRSVFLEITKMDKNLTDEFLRDGGIMTLESDTVSPDYDPADEEWKE